MADAVIDGGQAAPERRSRSRPRVTFAVTSGDPITRLLPEWAALAARSAGDNLFFHPDFALAAIRYLDRSVAVATTTRPDGSLVAFAPFTHTRLGRVAPAARLWAHDYAPLGLPLVDRNDIAMGVAALLDGLAGEGSMIIPDLPLDGPVATAFIEIAARDDRPVDILDGHRRATLDRSGPLGGRDALPPRRRKEFGRQMRRLGDHGSVSIETRVDPAEVRSRFEVFMALEAAGWKGKRGTALISSEKTADFAREVVRVLADAGSARIDSIDVDRQPIAMVVTFAAGETAFTWKIAYDETYARYSPGAQLMLEVAGGIFSDPTIRRIDSCAAADHPMIDHLWSGRMSVGTLVIGPPGGSLLHRIGVATARAELAARGAVRRVRG